MGYGGVLGRVPGCGSCFEYDFYIKAIDLMAQIHNIDVAKYKGESFTKLAFDTEKLYAEMEFTKKYFLKKPDELF